MGSVLMYQMNLLPPFSGYSNWPFVSAWLNMSHVRCISRNKSDSPTHCQISSRLCITWYMGDMHCLKKFHSVCLIFLLSIKTFLPSLNLLYPKLIFLNILGNLDRYSEKPIWSSVTSLNFASVGYFLTKIYKCFTLHIFISAVHIYDIIFPFVCFPGRSKYFIFWGRF